MSFKKDENQFYKADHPFFQYVGRIDFSDPIEPKFWNPGVYVKAKFKGTGCIVLLKDEVLGGKSYNYIELVVDGTKHFRVRTTGSNTFIDVIKGLSDTEHSLIICKDTEVGMGYVKFVGLVCAKLLPCEAKPIRKIEFYGNSITCGAESDYSEIACGAGKWGDNHNAYMSYGAETARRLNAQWHLSSVSGIGLIHSCCDMKYTMPDVYNKLNLQKEGADWDFKKYIPDVVTVCLGQNDGVQDSSKFCGAYVQLIKNLRLVYPQTQLVLLSSPMANDSLRMVLQKYTSSIVKQLNKQGDLKVNQFFFSRSWNSGCGEHPDKAEHQLIANELTPYLKKLMAW